MAGRNALVIEMGMGVPGVSFEAAREGIVSLRKTCNGWLAEGQIQGFHDYMLVTGNRSQRSIMVVIDLDHEQLEALVMSRSWIDLQMMGMQLFQNFSSNRAVDLERIEEGPPD